MTLTIRASTQIVIASGIQISSPVMRIFFIDRVGLRQARTDRTRIPPAGATEAQAGASDFDSDLPSDLLGLASLLSDFPAPESLPSVLLALESLPSDFAALLSPVATAVFAAGFEPLFLKSVAYQPLPLSWNPAAESILEKVFLLHSGHTVMTGSETFRRYSFWNPQDEQRYS